MVVVLQKEDEYKEGPHWQDIENQPVGFAGEKI